MRAGAVAMLDALGFKGIWTRLNAQVVLAQLQTALGQFGLGTLGSSSPAQVTFVSDSVFIGSSADFFEASGRDPATARAMAMQTVCELSQVVWSTMLSFFLPQSALAYRGAISWGEFEMTPPFVIGPAIDNSAEWEQLGDIAAIWLSPSALFIAQDVLSNTPNALNDSVGQPLVVEYEVPLKGGSTFKTMAIRPTDTPSRATLERGLNQALQPVPPSGLAKFQNTRAFLRLAP
jgi:hypothetical protein